MARGGQRVGDDSDGSNGDNTCPAEEVTVVLLFQSLVASLAETRLPTFSRKARKLDSSM